MRLIDADAYAFPGDLIHEPTIEAEPAKHGRWDAREMKDIGTYTVYWCSECNNFSYFKHNYCPNCGAKMDLEGE